MRRRAVAAVARAAAHVIDAATPASRPRQARRGVSGVRSPFDATPRSRTPVARESAPTGFPRRLSADASSPGTRDSRMSIITPALAARLDATVRRRDDLLQSLVADPPPPHRQMASINKELSRVERVVAAWDRVRCRREEIESLTSVLRDLKSEDDEELRAMASAERDDVERDVREIEERLALLLLPRDDADDATGAVLEVRAGAGGDEAALFAADLLKMYELLAKKRGWRFEMLSSSRQESGGFREAAASLEAVSNDSSAFETDSAYSALRFESGVHRVQRVPATETQGRVHTSTASVAVLPQLDELDMDGLVREEDVRVDTMRASGAGGQHVNTTNSAVRLTHAPTNTVVICQDERSQHKNKDKAFKVLRARVAEAKRVEAHASRADARRGLIGSGDRSERVRTYNFKEGRVKDHRVNHLSNDLEGFLSGGDALREMLDVLEREDRKRRLEAFDEAFGK